MKYCLLIYTILFLPILILAQEHNIPKHDLILLKNNLKIEGTILEVGKSNVYLKSGSIVHTIGKSQIKCMYPAGQKISFLASEVGDIFLADTVMSTAWQDTMKSTNLNNGNTIVAERDIIILKNRSKLEGEIVDVSNNHVLLKVNNLVYTLKKKEIKRMFTKGSTILLPAPDKKNHPIANLTELKLKKTLKDGFYNITYGNIVKRDNNESSRDGFYPPQGIISGLGIQNITGYQFSKYVGLGVGLGIITYEGYRNSRVIPFFTEFRGYLSDKKVAPYYNLAIGFNLAASKIENSIDEKRKGGAFFHPSIGYKFGSDESAFMIDLGVQIANINYEYNTETVLIKENRRYQRVVLRLGIML